MSGFWLFLRLWTLCFFWFIFLVFPGFCFDKAQFFGDWKMLVMNRMSFLRWSWKFLLPKWKDHRIESLNLQPSDIKGNGASWLRQPVKVESRLNLKYVYLGKILEHTILHHVPGKNPICFISRCFEHFCGTSLVKSFPYWPWGVAYASHAWRDSGDDSNWRGVLPQQKSLPSDLSFFPQVDGHIDMCPTGRF